MKIEIELDPDEFRTIKEYSDAQKVSVSDFIRALVLREIAPHEESE